MEEQYVSGKLSRSDLIEIIRNIPDTVIAYDRNGEEIARSNIVVRHNLKRDELAAQGGKTLIQIKQSEQELMYAVRNVLNTGKPMTFIHTAPHYECPTLFTVRPILDEQEQVKFVIANGRSQAVVNKFSQEYLKLEQQLERNQESVKLLSQLHLKTTDIVAESPAIRQVLKDVYRVAQTESTITIMGESGTGKEVIANIIHQNSARRDNLFIPVNCAAIPPELMESEFFGYVPGAFTGAKSGGSVGLFELANHGTILLDEIGELPLSLQPKLLRVLESGEIRPVGSSKSKKVDVRVIAATNRNLAEMVRNKEFREDLYYRLQIIPLELPALRDRPEDIIPLAEHYLVMYNKKHRRHCYLTNGAKEELMRYSWPGNIRELRNLIERLVIISDVDSIFQMQLLAHKASVEQDGAIEGAARASEGKNTYYEAVTQFEKAYIEQAILSCDGDIAKAAERMGVHKSMVYKKLKKFKEDEKTEPEI